MFDGEAFGAEIVAHVRSHVANSIAPLLSEISMLKARIAELETREPLRGDKGEPGDIGPPGEVGPPGREGVGIASAFIDREGNLVLTFTDGTVGSVGKVMGGQGPPGVNGIDGKDGKDGRDGFGFDDIQVAMLEDGHTLQVKFVRGEAVKIFPVVLPNTKYCKIWIEGREYMVGDLVTWNGSLWHCNNVTGDRPGLGSPHWTLATKCGRDGRNGKDGSAGPPGPAGPRGRDLTQMAFDGTKF